MSKAPRTGTAHPADEPTTSTRLAPLVAAYHHGRELLAIGTDPLAADADDGLEVARQTAGVVAVLIVGITGLIGLLIFTRVSEALPANHSLSSTQENITTGFGNAMELLPIIMIVLLSMTVIAVVARMGGR